MKAKTKMHNIQWSEKKPYSKLGRGDSALLQIVFFITSVRAQEGHFNFIGMGVCGHRIGKLTYPQTNAGPKTDPFSDYLQ